MLENLTRDHDDHVIMNKAGLHSSGEISKFYNFTKWNETKENVIYNHFDPTYGQCFTIDISPLIGKAGPNDIENKMSLHLFTKSYQNYSKYHIYLHNGSDIYALHENMPTIPFGGYMFGGFKLVIEKTIINSLPTKTYLCLWQNILPNMFENYLSQGFENKLQLLHPYSKL